MGTMEAIGGMLSYRRWQGTAASQTQQQNVVVYGGRQGRPTAMAQPSMMINSNHNNHVLLPLNANNANGNMNAQQQYQHAQAQQQYQHEEHGRL